MPAGIDHFQSIQRDILHKKSGKKKREILNKLREISRIILGKGYVAILLIFEFAGQRENFWDLKKVSQISTQGH